MILRYFVDTEITAPIVKLELEVPGDAKPICQAKPSLEFAYRTMWQRVKYITLKGRAPCSPLLIFAVGE